MHGPGEYVPDATEGITRVEDLPKPRIERRSRNYPARRCPRCGARAGRYATATRTLHDLGDTCAGRPIDMVVTFSRHHCPDCDFCFPADLSDLALPKCQYTRRVQELAVRLVAEDGLPYQAASGTCGATTASSSPTPPSRTGSRRPGKKKIDSMSTTYLDEALADFSGYLAIDELYDGPFCVLSVVDNRRYNRLAFRVLDHNPTHEDIRAFLKEFKGQLDKRGLAVRGITTDGSSLYPKVLKELWPDVRAPGLPLPRPHGDHQGGAAGAGETPQGDDRADPQAATGPAKQGGPGAGAADQAAEAARGRVVRAPPPVRPAPPQRSRRRRC